MVGALLQHYRIRQRLGAGGMGEVYLAEDTRLGRDVALKLLSAASQADQERRARLLTEARAASALRSSHIAAIYDIGEHDGAIYLVMEYVEGTTLSQRLKDGPLPIREALGIALQVADALSEAHSRGIVHRDVKSANIIVTPRGQAKVLDFGLAKFIQPPAGSASLEARVTFEETLAGMVLGTVSYMSPEQALGRQVDGRSDLFSLGVVLYEMVTGRLPFEGRTFAEIVDAIINQPPPAPARFNYEIMPALESIIRKALEKNPDFRYQTARDFYIDLHRLKDELDDAERHRAGGTSHRLDSSAERAPAVPRSASIAVMTFTNITREPADEWIGSGIAETVSADLKNIHNLSVIGRERIFDALRNLQSSEAAALDDRFGIEIGRGLGARWIVAGGYQRFGDKVRITARFVDVDTGVVLRNVKIDGSLSDIFTLQDRIVFELTRDLNLELQSGEIAEIQKPETRSVEAYELYSRGMMALRMASRDAPDRAILLFEKALAIDPEYAAAWAGLGGGYQLKGAQLSMPELLEKAIAYERRALALDPSLADAHAWLGSALLALGRPDEALEAFRQAVALEPGQARPWSMLARGYWIGKGRLTEGIEALERAAAINPQFGYAYLQLAFLYTETGDFEKAEAAAQKAVDLQERYISGEEGLIIVGAHTRLGYVRYRQGRYEEALKEYQSELLFLTATDHALRVRSLIELHQKLGAAYLRLGRREDAERHLALAIRSYEERLAQGVDDPQTKYYVALAHALRGERERAITYLQQTYERLGALNRRRAANDPDLESLRDELRDRGLI
ncbi:MAG TPA: protein kinase [Vicinamibacterales bacterium]|nr:protein kinase [Vicinamibacterales bacterium]